MRCRARWIVPALLLLGLAACGQPRKSVFPPTVSVQQLEIRPDGRWHVQLRLQNNSYTGMKFLSLHLTMSVRKQPAATLDAPLDLDIPNFAADVATVDVRPDPAAAAALAAALPKGSAASVPYALEGTVQALPDQDSKPRSFDVSHDDWLSPVPGIPDTFR